ncbi:MAG: fibronectin type III domain-containing protein [Thermoplasmata archaeon]
MSINIESVNSLNNFIFSNIFFYYTPNIYDEGRNYWNSSTTGNFWCDHVLPDNNSDGIVDVPQPIYGNGNIVNYDYFPVVNLPGSFIVPHTYPYMCMEEVRTDVVTVRNISKASVFYRTSTEEDYQCAEMEICFWSSNLKSYRWKIVVWDLPTPYPGFPMYYFFWVIDDCGNTLISPECYTYAYLSTSAPPTNLTLTVSATKIFLSWEPPGDIGGAYLREYKIYRGDSLFNKSIVASVDANTTTYVDSNVTPGITYYYHVTAANAIGESEPSNTVSAIPGSVPLPPQNLTAEVKRRSVLLKWDVPLDTGAPPLTAYNIYRGPSTENKTLIATVDASTTTHVDFNVTLGITSYYHVTAVNAIGESEPSNTVCVTVPAKLFAKILVPKTTLRSGEEILLSVVVTYADGRGVENATVSLSTQLPGRFESETGQTDANGTFTTKFVAGNVNSSVFGKVVATVSAEGYENATASILLGILPGEMRITVEIDKREVRVGENFTLVVWVRDENGNGIENASVEICGNGMVTGEYQKLTDGHGRAVFTFSALKEGNVVFQVIANNEGFGEARAGAVVTIKSMPE